MPRWQSWSTRARSNGKLLWQMRCQISSTPITRSRKSQSPIFSVIEADLSNVAEPYLWSEDTHHPFHVVKPPFASGEIMAGAMSAKSTTNDLLKFYADFMQALEDQTVHNTTSTAGSPFKFASKLIEPQVSLSGSPSDLSKGSYALNCWLERAWPTDPRYFITSEVS